MKHKFFLYTLLGCCLAFGFTACIKDNTTPAGTSGSTFIKFLEAPSQAYYFSPFTTVDTFDVFAIRKDANSETNTNTATTVDVTVDPTLIDAYNNDNGSSFESLPDSLYTLLNANFTKTGTGYTVNFDKGVFSQEFTIALDGSKWDVSHTYAMGLVISSMSGGDPLALSSGKDTLMVFVSVKNKYDGKYTVTGSMVDYSNSGLTGNYPWDVELRTSGPNSVIVYDVAYDYILHQILSGTDWSYYGSFGMEFTFDPATNAVISVTNPYGQPSGNGRSAELDPSGTNTWDPASKTLKVKYWMDQPSVITPHRVSFDETFSYTGPR